LPDRQQWLFHLHNRCLEVDVPFFVRYGSAERRAPVASCAKTAYGLRCHRR